MITKNEEKLAKVKNMLESKDIFYTELANGQLKVDKVNLWATTEKWYDEKTGAKGQGINSFIKHLKEHEII